MELPAIWRPGTGQNPGNRWNPEYGVQPYSGFLFHWEKTRRDQCADQWAARELPQTKKTLKWPQNYILNRREFHGLEFSGGRRLKRTSACHKRPMEKTGGARWRVKWRKSLITLPAFRLVARVAFSVTGLKGSFACHSHPRRPLFPLSYPNPPLPFLLIDPCCTCHMLVVEYYGTRTLSLPPLAFSWGEWAPLLPTSSPFTLLAQQSKDPTIESTYQRQAVTDGDA